MEPKETFNQKPIVEQIYDELIYSIEGQEEFDSDIIQSLRLLANGHELNKIVKVREAISNISEHGHEDS
jgi:DNA-binding transcriptional regulator YhcF (GntR family)